jgi:hypothetical protein
MTSSEIARAKEVGGQRQENNPDRNLLPPQGGSFQEPSRLPTPCGVDPWTTRPGYCLSTSRAYGPNIRKGLSQPKAFYARTACFSQRPMLCQRAIAVGSPRRVSVLRTQYSSLIVTSTRALLLALPAAGIGPTGQRAIPPPAQAGGLSHAAFDGWSGAPAADAGAGWEARRAPGVPGAMSADRWRSARHLQRV